MTEADVRQRLIEACRSAKRTHWNERYGISRREVRDCLLGLKPPTRAILDALGIMQVVAGEPVYEWRGAPPPTPPGPSLCPTCAAEVTAIRRHGGGFKYCSYTCRKIANQASMAARRAKVCQ